MNVAAGSQITFLLLTSPDITSLDQNILKAVIYFNECFMISVIILFISLCVPILKHSAVYICIVFYELE